MSINKVPAAKGEAVVPVSLSRRHMETGSCSSGECSKRLTPAYVRDVSAISLKSRMKSKLAT